MSLSGYPKVVRIDATEIARQERPRAQVPLMGWSNGNTVGGYMSCCIEFDQAMRDRMIIYSAPHEVTDGPFMNEILSEYFLVKTREGGNSYYAIKYCPFCGK